MNISDTLAPNSDQLDAVDLLGGARTFTVERVSQGNAEQPVQVHLAEFPRPWRPGKSMRRVLASVWGVEAAEWAGRRLTLFCDTSVKFGGEAVGGVRISHMSHLDKPKTIPLLVTRGRSAPYTVQPLKEKSFGTSQRIGVRADVDVPIVKSGKPADVTAVPSLKSRVWDRSREIEPDLTDDERRNWIKGELASLGGDTPENLTALLSNWESK